MYELEEFVDGFVFGDVFEDRVFAAVNMHFPIGAADIAVVGIGHFAGSVDKGKTAKFVGASHARSSPGGSVRLALLLDLLADGLHTVADIAVGEVHLGQVAVHLPGLLQLPHVFVNIAQVVK